MPGPAEFYGGVRPPTYPQPEPINFSVLGNLMDAYREGQQYKYKRDLQTMFAPGTPGAAALEQSGVDPNSLPGMLIRQGGAPSAEPFAQKLLQQQIFQNIYRNLPNMPPGPDPGGGPSSSNEGPNANMASAFKNAIFGQESGYGRDPSTSYAGARGPMQIMPKTFAANALPGERIDNKDDNMRVGNRILDKYLTNYNGDWARAAVAYYSGEGNVAPPGSPTPWKVNRQPPPRPDGRSGGPSVAQYVQQVGARMRGGGQGIQPGTGTGTSAPAPVESPGPNANLALIGSPPPFAPMLASAQSTNASGPQNIRLASASGDLSGLLSSPQEPASEEIIPTSSMEVASNQGQGAGASPVAGPITPGGRDTLSQAPAPQEGRALPPGAFQIAQANIPSVAPGPGQNLPTSEYTPERAAAYERAARELEDHVQRMGIASGASGLNVPTTGIQERIKDYNAKAAEIRKFLGERSQKSFDVGIEGQKLQQKEAIDAASKKINAMSTRAETFGREQGPILDLSERILNTPGIYTGIGGERAHEVNKLVASLFGDTQAAYLQDVLKKATATSINQTINAMRFDMAEAGGNAGKVYASQMQPIKDASPTLETTLAGNRALVQIQKRLGMQAQDILQEAVQFRKTHQGLLGDAWDEHLTNYLTKNPIFTQQELANPVLIGVATVPPGIEDPKTGRVIPGKEQDYIKWRDGMKIRRGDPIRSQNGQYVGAP